MKKFFTVCIMCPLGCNLTVIDDDGTITVSGNTCPRGKTYGTVEYKSPMRIVTTIVKTESGEVLSCKTKSAVPKNKIFDTLSAIKCVTAKNDVKIGDVLITNVCGTGVDVVASSELWN